MDQLDIIPPELIKNKILYNKNIIIAFVSIAEFENEKNIVVTVIYAAN